MRQTMEDGVSEVLSSVVEDIGEAVTRNISGAQILHELLSAPWLHALLKIYECLIQFQKMKPNPFLPYASGLSYEIMTLIQRAPHPSPEARELFGLLSSPHVQALLSSHDSVAQEDYLPVLPPLPDELPEDEEAMRIVCLVKNNQPLTSSEHRSLDHGRGGLHSSWNSLHCIPLEPPTSAKRAWSGEELRRTETEAKHPSHPKRSQPQGFVTHYEMSGNCVFCPQNAVLWKQRLNLSEPAVFSPNTLPGKRKTRFTCSHGATIRRDEETGEIYIARVIHGGLADRSGLLHPGDLIVEVNGNPVVGLEPAKVIRILTNSTGTILFKVIPNSTQVSSNQKPVYMRAMVDYCPRKDSSIPCPDAGMSFSRGDLLEVVDQSDAQWWQARKLPCGASFARLIPSASTLKSKQREHWWCQPLHVHTCMRPLASAASENEQTSVDDKSMTEMDNAQDIKIDEADSDFTEGIYLAGFRRSFHVWKRTSFKKRRQSCSSCSPNSSAMATPYEEVVLYQRPPQENHRLIMLVGASGVGVNELRKRLIKLNPSTFQGPVPHTTRPMREGEQMGREYHFVTKELFEYMVCNHRFVEYGESKGHLYGTSFDSIDEVLKHGRMCIVDAESHSIPILRTRKLKPFVIFIKPPSPERLRQTRKNATILTNDAVSRPFTEEDFVEMEEVSRLIETKYKQFFDSVLVNDGLQDASMKLCSIIHQAQNEPQWIPVNWILSEEQ